ncbi:MAG: RlmE family RNA methyltransferase, partial [Deltaproteobacteria bacterium]
MKGILPPGHPAGERGGMRKVHDHYFQRAKREHYRARSVYKLEAIDRKFSILRRGARVLDLGCAPGSWSQYAARIVGEKGLVVGIDRQGVALPELANVRMIEGDVAAFTWEGEPFHVVLSDLAPATTGVKHTDHHRS